MTTMKKYLFAWALLAALFAGCKQTDEEFLEKEPPNIFTNPQLWSNPDLIYQAVADIYRRYVDYQYIGGWYDYGVFDEAFVARSTEWTRHKNANWGYDMWTAWDYTYIRHMNLFIRQCQGTTVLDEAVRKRYEAEVRWLRAAYYFEMARRVGGAPLILEPLQYDFQGDPTYLQYARSKESDMYDFVISEMDALVNGNMLPADAAIKSRATRGLALALQARAAIYAGSIAKYGATTPSVTLPGDIVGIPASKAAGYYAKALDAAQRIIDPVKGGGQYSLYMKTPTNLEDNFAELFLDKSATNTEVIWMRDYLSPSQTHQFTVFSIPTSMKEDASFAGALNPSLNLVQQFEMLDNTFKPIAQYTNALGPTIPMPYANQGDIFAGRDARLKGSILLPGMSFRGRALDFQAGYVNFATQAVITGSTPGATGNLPNGATVKLVGNDGPLNAEFCSNTGFYIRKYNDTKTGTGSTVNGSDVAWIRYRYAEVLLIAAEASMELGNGLAASYLNQVRRRAGFTTDLTEAQVTFDRIVHERRVELAFEGHQLWDMKRWRIADKVWNGTAMSVNNFNVANTNLGKATEVNTEVWGLWPYKVFAATGMPAVDQFNGYWIFIPVKPSNVTASHAFRMGNYYSQIATGNLSKNPQLIQNPNQ
jgi:hypothetical protein